MDVFETEKAVAYLKSRHILKEYKKAKSYILEGHYQQVQLKKRHPYSCDIWYFRITRKYRAYAKKEENRLVVFEISDHQ
jgi:anthranilate/para-aminobenzoate synthase component I